MSNYTCQKCKAKLRANEAYEYRGVFACEPHFDEVVEMRDFERNQIIKEEHNKTKVFKGLDLSDSTIGKANQRLLNRFVKAARKESQRLKNYEGR
ncbi:LIM and senescent cell antigen-like-containing domain protein [Pseudoalteromonas phage vB_Pun_Y3]